VHCTHLFKACVYAAPDADQLTVQVLLHLQLLLLEWQCLGLQAHQHQQQRMSG
jgi:hypothetical protein